MEGPCIPRQLFDHFQTLARRETANIVVTTFLGESNLPNEVARTAVHERDYIEAIELVRRGIDPYLPRRSRGSLGLRDHTGLRIPASRSPITSTPSAMRYQMKTQVVCVFRKRNRK